LRLLLKARRGGGKHEREDRADCDQRNERVAPLARSRIRECDAGSHLSEDGACTCVAIFRECDANAVEA
jgi:hypothetical protein